MKKAVFYIGLGLIPIIALILAQAPLLSIQNEYLKAKEQYTTALVGTREQLNQIGNDMKSDISLTQNLQTDGYGAIGRILSGFIKPGRIDYLAILDQNCHIVAHSEQGMPLTETCPIDHFSPLLSSQFQWRSVHQTPSLDLLTPIKTTDQRTFFLLASAYLNNNWLFAYPELKESFRERDLTIGQQSGGLSSFLVLEEGTNPAIASLYSRDPLLAVFPQLLRHEPFTLIKPLWGALAFFCLTLYFVFRSIKGRENELSKALTLLQEWAQDLAPEPSETGSAAAKKPPAKAALVKKPELLVREIEERMNRLTKRNFEAIQRCQHQNQLLQQQTVGLESRLMEQQAEQAWFQQARSLHQQMLACAKSHIQKLQEVYSLGEDISHLAAHQLARPAQKLFDIGSRWDHDLAAMSARKFLRSLSERLDEQGVSELDHSLRFILDQSHEVHNTAINLTLLTQRLLEDLQSNMQLAEHWHQMMGGKDSEQRTLLSLINDSQAMIKLQDQHLRYENLVDKLTKLDHLDIAPSSVSSAIYHCYQALIEAARDRGASEMILISQLKKREERSILVISIKGDWSDELNHDMHLSPKAEQHLYLAMQLLQGHPMKISQLPAIQGIQAIALLWEAEAARTQASPAKAFLEKRAQPVL